jgi:Tfp pilus assembly protein PilF
MWRLWLGFCLCWLLFGPMKGLAQQGPDQQYVHIYSTIQEGDRLLARGQPRAALNKYLEAREALQRLEKNWPDWNPRIVRFRLQYLAEQIARATAASPAGPARPLPEPSPTPPTPSTPEPDPALLREIESLRQQVAQLQADKALLEARLREALSVQPAATDPRELARAEARIRDLEKERDLLKAALEDQQRRLTAADRSAEIQQLQRELEQTRRELAEQTELARRLARDKAAAEEQLTAHGLAAARELQQARERIAALEQELAGLRAQPATPPTAPPDVLALQQELQQLQQRLAEQTGRAEALARENERLQQQLAALTSTPADKAALDKLQQALSETQRQLREQENLSQQLTTEKTRLLARLEELRARTEALETLRAENALLKQQLANLTADAAARTNTLEELRQARLRLATLQSDLEILRLERAALEQRLVTARSNETALARESTETIANLRARLAALEADPVPFTPEELALLRAPAPTLLPAGAAKPSSPPSSTGPSPVPAPVTAVNPREIEDVLERARRAFDQDNLEEAARLCREVLQQVPRHPIALANLALVSLRQNRPDEARTHAEAALEQAPDNARVRSVLGQVLLQTGRYDEALNQFSRAAELDPRNAEIQNYLGLALSHQGHRAAAESAFRRAILLQPGYAAAHHNLAVFYLHRDPPLLELARWHYQKARAAGFPPNPELESALARTEPPPPD